MIPDPTTLDDQKASAISGTAASPIPEEGNQYEEHFKTEHLLANLRGHTISSGAITFSAQAAKFFLHLASTVTLARLLTPRDFGLVAMVTTITGFLRVFKDAGLSIATVQRERVTHAQVSNLFWINVAVSVVCTLVAAILAPIIASFYHDSRLLMITLLLSGTFIISGSTIQHQALLKRQMRFKALALIEVGSITIGVLVGVTMALFKCRYWSLVGLSLTMEIAGLVLTWFVSRWRPRLPSRGSGIGPMVTFGASRTLGDFISYLTRGSDILLIGRFYGAGSVGLYSRASALLIQPLQQLLMPINAVFMPALSRLQSQPERYRSTFLRLYGAIAVMGFFFTGLFLALSRPLTQVLLGPKWDQAAVIFGGFTIAALTLPLANATIWLFTSQGRGGDLLVAQLINGCVTVLSFVAGLPFGPIGVAIAYSVSGPLIRLPVLYFVVGRHGPVKTSDLWISFYRHLPLWFVVLLAASLTRNLLINYAPIVQLLICGPVGVLAGAAFIYSFQSQRRVIAHIVEVLGELRKKRIKREYQNAEHPQK